MGEIVGMDEEQMHRRFAVDCFNKIWPLLEKQDRTEEENDLMINLGHTSLYHWVQVGKFLNIQRGEWILARIYTILGYKDQALRHAKKCLSLTEENDFKDFDLAYAYEARARTGALNGQENLYKAFFTKAESAGQLIENKGDRDLFMNDLNGQPWFGLR